jgi:acyl carrier protein
MVAMIISSRTPDGFPHRCPICAKPSMVEPSLTGDSTCPSCGQLLWWFRDQLRPLTGLSSDEIRFDIPLRDALGSLDVVELFLNVEEEFGVSIPDREIPHLHTLAHVIGYLQDELEDEAE